jgi:hypothetical protein
MPRDPNIIQVHVSRIVYDESVQTPIVILKENDGNRILPIWIGHAEASAIAYALEGVKVERPLTHDLIARIIVGVGANVEKIVINQLKENTFYARIILRMDSRIISIDARPSDSIAIALRTNAPIFVSRDVMEESAREE